MWPLLHTPRQVASAAQAARHTRASGASHPPIPGGAPSQPQQLGEEPGLEAGPVPLDGSATIDPHGPSSHSSSAADGQANGQTNSPETLPPPQATLALQQPSFSPVRPTPPSYSSRLGGSAWQGLSAVSAYIPSRWAAGAPGITGATGAAAPGGVAAAPADGTEEGTANPGGVAATPADGTGEGTADPGSAPAAFGGPRQAWTPPPPLALRVRLHVIRGAGSWASVDDPSLPLLLLRLEAVSDAAAGAEGGIRGGCGTHSPEAAAPIHPASALSTPPLLRVRLWVLPDALVHRCATGARAAHAGAMEPQPVQPPHGQAWQGSEALVPQPLQLSLEVLEHSNSCAAAGTAAAAAWPPHGSALLRHGQRLYGTAASAAAAAASAAAQAAASR